MRRQPLHSNALEERQRTPGRLGLRRLFFSTFPGGWPGLGLLLLRAAVGVTAIVQGGGYLAERGQPTLGTWMVGLLAVTSGVSLLSGFLTPVAGFVVGLGSLGAALSWFAAPAQNLLDTRLSLIFVIIVAVAIILLGPGAFSLDARLFGRREIIIPQTSRSPRP